jgi:hypothetical protein
MPSTSSLADVQAAAFGLLSVDATLLALCPDVHGYEPDPPPDRFIVVGNATEQAAHTLGGVSSGWGWMGTLTVHIYSYQQDELEALQILKRCTALLNRPDGITVAGYLTAILEYGDKITKVLTEVKDKRERRHIPALFTFMVHD